MSWLTIFGRTETAPLPAPSGTGVSLPAPITARNIKNQVRAAEAAEAKRGRLVFAVDATYSRQASWEAAKRLTDSLFEALPGSLAVALAVHGGGTVHTFTKFTSNPAELRDRAADVVCEAGGTRLLEILSRVLKTPRVGVVVYIGDCFEESDQEARWVADALVLHGTRVIILHEGPPPDAFAVIAERTGGALLPFDPAALAQLRELLQAVSVLAVGDVQLLEAKAADLPAATLLLEHLGDRKAISHRGPP
jgi:hypothetical protein